MKTNKKGISLIVLVIIIIIMVILAAAIILSLNGDRLEEKAKTATNASDLANARYATVLAKSEWKLMSEKEKEKYPGGFVQYAESELEEEGFLLEDHNGIKVSELGAVNTIYIGEDNRTAIIPEGFRVSSASTEDSVTEGLVVIDDKGNEFVWVPVDDMSRFIKTTKYGSELEAPRAQVWTEPFRRGELSATRDLTGEWAEEAAMRSSVEKYGGFYIGRYETGTNAERTADKSNGTTDIVVQRAKSVYTCVAWGPSMTSASGDIIRDGKNQGKGAVELSRKMYNGSNSVVSTLCYSVQWDSALQFIYKTDNVYPTDSTNKGNYTESLVSTGSSDKYSVNNIYDMAGNAYEWTMEGADNTLRAVRGGGIGTENTDTFAGSRWAHRTKWNI